MIHNYKNNEKTTASFQAETLRLSITFMRYCCNATCRLVHYVQGIGVWMRSWLQQSCKMGYCHHSVAHEQVQEGHVPICQQTNLRGTQMHPIRRFPLETWVGSNACCSRKDVQNTRDLSQCDTARIQLRKL